MKLAEASVYLDELRPIKTGESSLKIKISYNRKRKYFSTGIYLFKDEYEQIFYGKRKTPTQKEVFLKAQYLINKADDIIKNLPVFTFNTFEEHFLEERNVQNDVSLAFDKYIKQLKIEGRIGTASSYECAKNSLYQFNKNLTFADLTPNELKIRSPPWSALNTT